MPRPPSVEAILDEIQNPRAGRRPQALSTPQLAGSLDERRARIERLDALLDAVAADGVPVAAVRATLAGYRRVVEQLAELLNQAAPLEQQLVRAVRSIVEPAVYPSTMREPAVGGQFVAPDPAAPVSQGTTPLPTIPPKDHAKAAPNEGGA